MLELKSAMKNLRRAGLKTWLNAGVLSITFVIILFYNGMLDGWNRQAIHDSIKWETGSGQLWHPLYDPFDPYSFQDAHAPVNEEITAKIQSGHLTDILVSQATAYPGNRLINVILKGIRKDQTIIAMDGKYLTSDDESIHVIVGKRMASASNIRLNDRFIIRWRDKNGTFDAKEVHVAQIFDCNVPSVDNGIIWMDIEKLQEMTGLHNEATYLIASDKFEGKNIGEWIFNDLDFLHSDLKTVMQTKKGGAKVVYLLLLAIALLAVFDTQVLSIFRRQREIGTLIAMGMTRLQVVRIFTFEGTAYSILAILFSLIWGLPFLWMMQKNGIPMPSNVDDAGLPISEKIIPFYSIGMIMSTIFLVTLTSLIVSYLPSRKISRLKPTEAIKGKLQ